MFIVVLSNILFSLVLKLNISYGYNEINTSNDNKIAKFHTIEVEKGDNLWNIADKYNKNYEIREFIYHIRELNELNNSIIYPGQNLKLPN